MKNELHGELTTTFVRGGISKEKKNPYLQISDGIDSKFVTISDEITKDEFSSFVEQYERGDEITLSVKIDTSGKITLLSV